MPTWPATLPQKQFIGLTDTIDDPVARTPMDTGPSTARKRFTAVTRSVEVPIKLTGAQLQDFNTFFINQIDYGALSFDWEDPVTDVTVSFRFKSTPTWSLVKGGSVDSRVYETTLSLEIQP